MGQCNSGLRGHPYNVAAGWGRLIDLKLNLRVSKVCGLAFIERRFRRTAGQKQAAAEARLVENPAPRGISRYGEIRGTGARQIDE